MIRPGVTTSTLPPGLALSGPIAANRFPTISQALAAPKPTSLGALRLVAVELDKRLRETSASCSDSAPAELNASSLLARPEED